MSLWSRIADAVSALAQGESLSNVFKKLRTPPERRVAFAIAVIALGAKMAKADGHVTRDEVTAFREVFYIPKGEEAQAARVFNLARQDITGFEIYAASIAAMFRDNATVLEDLLEGLFFIAMADGEYHPKEDDFIHKVADIFGVSERRFRTLRTRFAPDAPPDAYDVLGVDPSSSLEDIRTAWRRAVRETHPDQMMSRGVPEEAINLATAKLIAVNRAWEEISAGSG
ncbi:MAG: molecular chaperone DjiA [Alphaproteobacteria bacterium]|nr:molecular chaperone DjiA [Alphaproteobacteria bacterium]